MAYVKSFRDLEVYQLARQLAKEIFEITKEFPKEEIYSLTSQIRRSSCANRKLRTENFSHRLFFIII
ncbi:MAG: four helix bundle protein [Bacteroidales bacterium]|nr:four helix bundle protein [Bacteroidales bacterium]